MEQLNERKSNCPACNALKNVVKSRENLLHKGCKLDMTISVNRTCFIDVCHLYIGSSIVLINGKLEIFDCHRYYDMAIGDRYFTPALRPLSSITKEEHTELTRISFEELYTLFNGQYQVPNPAKRVSYMLNRGFDLFDLIPNGQVLDATSFNNKKD